MVVEAGEPSVLLLAMPAMLTSMPLHRLCCCLHLRCREEAVEVEEDGDDGEEARAAEEGAEVRQAAAGYVSQSSSGGLAGMDVQQRGRGESANPPASGVGRGYPAVRSDNGDASGSEHGPDGDVGDDDEVLGDVGDDDDVLGNVGDDDEVLGDAGDDEGLGEMGREEEEEGREGRGVERGWRRHSVDREGSGEEGGVEGSEGGSD